MPNLPEEAGELFAASPDQFVTVRDALAKKLDKEGRGDEAKVVKKLRKPPLAVWAINQAARSHPELVERLGKVAGVLRAAGSSAELREASKERHSVIKQLAGAASAALEEGGHAAGGQSADKIGRTLLALSSDPEAQGALARGMLEKELEPELEFGFALPEADPLDPATSPTADRERRKTEELDGKVRELEKEVAGLEKAAKDAQDRLALAQVEAERAEQRLESARSTLEKARDARNKAGD